MANSDGGDGDRSVFADKEEALAVLRETAKSESTAAGPSGKTPPRKHRPASKKSGPVRHKNYFRIANYALAVLGGFGLGYFSFGWKPECTRDDLEAVRSRLDTVATTYSKCTSDLDTCKDDLDNCDDDDDSPRARVAVPSAPQKPRHKSPEDAKARAKEYADAVRLLNGH